MAEEFNNTWLILLGGEHSFLPLGVLNKEGYQGMICADSGANHAFEFMFLPEIVIGDLDSIDKQVKDYFITNGVEFIPYPKDKDYTDGELAIEEALKRGADTLYICGAFGGREDHELANIFLAARFSHLFRRIVLFGDDFYAFFANGKEKINVKGNCGDTLSLLPLSSLIKSITIEGFRYPLVNADLAFGSTWGLSNVLTKEIGNIYFKEGMLLVIHYHKPFDFDYIRHI